LHYSTEKDVEGVDNLMNEQTNKDNDSKNREFGTHLQGGFGRSGVEHSREDIDENYSRTTDIEEVWFAVPSSWPCFAVEVPVLT